MTKTKHILKQMSGDEAKKILQRLLGDLSGIDEDDLTSFELSVIRQCSTMLPSKQRGVEKNLTAIE